MPLSRSSSRRVRLFFLSLGLLSAASLGGCKGPEFYEKEHYGRAVMNLDDGAAEIHFYQKVYYSMEGSAGGIGTTAGGGCGCY